LWQPLALPLTLSLSRVFPTVARRSKQMLVVLPPL
jgi:hypothetical protein